MAGRSIAFAAALGLALLAAAPPDVSPVPTASAHILVECVIDLLPEGTGTVFRVEAPTMDLVHHHVDVCAP